VKIFIASLLVAISLSATAKELIGIQNPYGPTHSGNAATMKILDEANIAQKKYNFVLENRPGGNQSIALNYINQAPQSQLAIIAASFVENYQTGLVNKDLYVPVWSLGDACWAVFSTQGTQGNVNSLRGNKEIVSSSVGLGNATHLTSLVVGERLGIPVRYIVFKSANESLLNMVGNNGVTFTVDRAENFETFKPKNNKLAIIAMSCPQRHPAYPEIRTLREQGYEHPYVFNIVMAHRDMDAKKRAEIAEILTAAARAVSAEQILKMSGFVPPQFKGQTAQQHLDASVNLVSKLRAKYAKEIAADK
jgi:tripartite-type tricarboxylate transporter receptor subunit TctC